MNGDALTILYVDDDHDIREIVKLALGLDPTFDLHVCDGGGPALAMLDGAEVRPDLILLDVMMPGMDGPQLMREIRKRPEVAAVPVVFITARARIADREQYLRAGAVDVIHKPFDPLTLAAQVRELAKRHGAMVPVAGFEPATFGLQNRCSTN